MNLFSLTKFPLAGWGALNRGGATPDILQEANVTTISNKQCSRLYAAFNSEITDFMICTDTPGKVIITRSYIRFSDDVVFI